MFSAGILRVLVTASTGQANASLRRTQGEFTRTAAAAKSSSAATASSWRRAGTRISSIGSGLTRSISIPAAAAAGASAKLAIDFNEAMEKIRNLVGASQHQVDTWSKQLIDLAPKLGKSPKELADALYFVTSSGIDASKALGVVKIAAKASALGLGETETVADAVTSAMNSYKRAGLSAAEATNTLAQTVEKGKGEPEELAASIGRVIPVASALKVPFSDVGASLAGLTLQGLDAAEATTALRAVFTSTLKPTDDAEKALARVGLSAEDLRNSLATKGTLATLQMLSKRLKGNEEQVARVFPNVRALVGAFNLTGDSAKRNAQIFEEMRGKTRMVQIGFQRLSETEAFKLRQSLAGLQAAGVKIGQELLPALVPLAHSVANVAAAFASMPGFARDFLIGAIVLGPLIRGLGGIITMLSGIARLVGPSLIALTTSLSYSAVGTAIGLGIASAAALAIPAAIAAVGLGNIILSAVKDDWKAVGFKAGGAIAGGVAGGLVGGLPGALIGAGLGSVLGGLLGNLFGGEEELKGLRKRLAKSSHAIERFTEKERESSQSLIKSSKGVNKSRDRAQEASQRLRRAEKNLKEVRDKYPKDSAQVRVAEARVVRAKHRSAEASKELKRAEKVHGVLRKAEKANLRGLVAAEKDQINNLRDLRRRHVRAFEAAQKQYHQDKRQGALSVTLREDRKKLERAGRRLIDTDSKLGKVTIDYNKTLDRATNTIGPKFARQLRKSTQEQLEFGKAGKTTAKTLKNPFENTILDVGRSTRKTGDAFPRATNVAERAFVRWKKASDNWAQAVYKGQNVSVQNTQKAARTFGAKPKEFSLKVPGKQAGGFVVPGVGLGDKVPLHIGGSLAAMVEPNEVIHVLNRNASQQLGALESLNAQIPRLQSGGTIGGLQPGISALAKWSRGLGLSVFSGLRPGDDGFHGSGEAVDLVPPSMHATERIFASWKNQLEELFYDPWGGWDRPSGGRIDSIGGHMDHIHAAILGQGSGKGALGIAGMVDTTIPRVTLQGPESMVLDMGQAELDTIRKAAHGYLERLAPKGMLGASVATGPIQQMAKQMVKQIWGMGQWPPFVSLEMAEAGWDPKALNPTSGAAGLAQALPASKYPPGAWPYQGLESAKLQLSWMMNYIKDRYGDPAGAWAFHQANNWYRQGGVLDALGGSGVELKKGGGIHLGKLLKPGKKTRKKMQAYLKDIKSEGLPPKLAKRLKSLRDDVNRFSEYADRAASLNTEDVHGNVEFGNLYGKTEVGWLQEEIEKLRQLRNQLLRGQDVMAKSRRGIAKQLKAAKDKLKDWKKRSKHWEKEQRKVGKKMQTLRDELEKRRSHGGAESAGELKRKIDHLRARLKHAKSKSAREDIRKELKRAHEQLEHRMSNKQIADRLDKFQHHWKHMHDLKKEADFGVTRLKDKIIPGLREHDVKLKGKGRELGDSLAEVQGYVEGQTAHRRIGAFHKPYDWRFGGEIFDVMSRLRDLQAPTPPATADTGMDIGQLVEFARLVRFGAFDTTPFMGGFAKGGLALVGETGPELVHVPHGTRVHDPSATSRMLDPTIINEFEIYVNGKRAMDDEIEIKHKKQTRSNTRRLKAGVRNP